MAALRGVSLSEVLRANMKNIQEVYRIKMKVGQFQKEINCNSVDWQSESSKGQDEQTVLPVWLGGSDDSSDVLMILMRHMMNRVMGCLPLVRRTEHGGQSQAFHNRQASTGCNVKQPTFRFSSPTSRDSAVHWGEKKWRGCRGGLD